MSHPSKRRGYDGERFFEKALRIVFPNLRRTGSIAYKLDAADLVQNGHLDELEVPVRIVATRDHRGTPLVTMSVEDLVTLVARGGAYTGPVVVAVKRRQRTWLGTVYEGLKEATK